ncbi:MAG: hypothetical protein U9N47_05090, partial [Thermodesulfobacteriota bacterium]|nr:hypothetical protein [Thermodesulfobacteriota bacterium]
LELVIPTIKNIIIAQFMHFFLSLLGIGMRPHYPQKKFQAIHSATTLAVKPDCIVEYSCIGTVILDQITAFGIFGRVNILAEGHGHRVLKTRLVNQWQPFD